MLARISLMAVAVCGCAESTPEPLSPRVSVVNSSTGTPEVSEEATPKVPSEILSEGNSKSVFAGLSADEKLNRIGEAIRQNWGDGTGFQFAPEGQPGSATEDPLVLTLRWKSIEQKIVPMLKEAFDIEGDLRCRFTRPGEVECNHPIYQIAIERAQGRPTESVSRYSRVDATLKSYAPVLRAEFQAAGSRDNAFYEAIRTSLRELSLPAGLKFATDQPSPENDDNICELFTEWASLPPDFAKSSDSDSFRWRLQLTIQEAVGSITSESDNLRSDSNRLELISFIQYQHRSDEPQALIGPLSVTAIGFTPKTLISRWGSSFKTSVAPASVFLETLDEFQTAGDYPRPSTFVGNSPVTMKIVGEVHKFIEQHLTEPNAE